MASIRQLQNEVARCLVAARETGSTASLDALRAARAALGARIANGAVDCPGCGSRPHGMMQPSGWEIGCIGPCRHAHAWARTLEHVVERWNRGAELWAAAGQDVLPFALDGWQPPLEAFVDGERTYGEADDDLYALHLAAGGAHWPTRAAYREA